MQKFGMFMTFAIAWKDMSKHTASGVSVMEFGALGNGVADDWPAIQAALSSGARCVTIPEGVFLIRRPLEPAANQHLVVHGTVRLANAEIQALSRDVAIGDNEIHVEDASGFAIGEWVTLHDNRLPIQGGGRKTRRQSAGNARIVAMAENRITLDRRSARDYLRTAGGLLARQHGGIWIRHSGVRISGGGVIDGNRANQLNAAPGFLEDELGEDWRAASGIVAAGDSVLSHIIIEDVTVCDFALQGICFQDTELSAIRNATCLRMHDKSITLHRCRDIQITGNTCCDSEWEDGIMLHQCDDPCDANHGILIQGNICRNNARYGIHVGAKMREVFLANNLCTENGLNLSIFGDHCTSTGDVALGTTDRLYQADVYRPNVLIAGRNVSVVNLTARGTRFVGVQISGQQISLLGGQVGEMTPPLPESENGGKRVTEGEWGLGTGEFYVRGDSRIGIALVPELLRGRRQILPESARISGVIVHGCRVALKIAAGAKDIDWSSNNLESNEITTEIAEAGTEQDIGPR